MRCSRSIVARSVVASRRSASANACASASTTARSSASDSRSRAAWPQSRGVHCNWTPADPVLLERRVQDVEPRPARAATQECRDARLERRLEHLRLASEHFA